MGLAEGGDRGQRVENIAHCAEPDHEQAELGLRVQTLIFSQGRVVLGGFELLDQPVYSLVFVFDFDAKACGLERQ